jgi:hypothetical protein
MTPTPAEVSTPARPPQPPDHFTTVWLGGGAFVNLAALIAVAIWLPQNQVLFTLLAAQFSGFSGAFLLRLKG